MDSHIVITGAGVISPIGAGLADFERALYAGASGMVSSQLLAEAVPPPAVVAEIRDFTPQQWLGNKGLRVLDRTARLLCVAAQMALSGSGLSPAESPEADPEMGLVCGTMFGSIHSITSFDWSGLEDGPNLVNPMDFPNTVINSAAGQTAIKFKLGGINSTICCGLASGLYALHYAAEFLRLGRARLLLAGGAEELSEEAFLGFQKNGILSAAGAARPFAATRDGAVLGEGATLLVLETAEGARQRGAQPWAELVGFGCAHDAHSTNAYDIEAAGATAAIRGALQDAGIAPGQVACFVSSASGSRAGDAMEARALRNVFGPRFAEVPVCAPKAALGESLGAAGATAALIAALALQKQCLSPTPGLPERGAEGVRLSCKPQAIHGEYALVNAFSCDGNNAAMVLRRWNQ
ncbi:MAG TPA: beta-ketoacyl synthase N-terminal-like domain-containing protein [Terriglobia bacterium]|nr:beta-ketoacyl synthase N-terminal-like domain-containing protein [Terriglobia bacterium]